MFFVQIAGRLGKDPEARFTASGQKVTTFSLAVSHRKGKEESTIWVRVTIWGDRFEKLMPYIKKGSGLIVVGKMSPPSTYVDKEGRTQVSVEVTAEAIEFNPFGKSDSSENSGVTQTGDHAQGQGSSSSYGASFGGYGSNPNGSFQQSQPQYAPQQGQGSFTSSIDEDTLPF